MNTLKIVLYLSGIILLVGAEEISDADCESSRYIGNKYYRSSILLNVSLFNKIVIDDDGNIFYRTDQDKNMYIWKINQTTPEIIKGFTRGMAQDCVMDIKGNILISTTKGIYKYNYETSTATFFRAAEHVMYKMTIVENGSIYATNNYNSLYHINDEEIKQLSVVPKAGTIAFNSEGDMYYVETGLLRYPHVLRHGHHESIKISGVKSTTTYLIVVDNRSDYVYLCHDDGLYFVKPDSYYAKRVKGYDRAQAMGFDSKGNMYLGTRTQFLKLEPLPGNPCDSEVTTAAIAEDTKRNEVPQQTSSNKDSNSLNSATVAKLINDDVMDKIVSLNEKNKTLVAMVTIHSIGLLLIVLAAIVYFVKSRRSVMAYKTQENVRDSSIEYTRNNEEFVNFE